MGEINIANPKGRDAVVALESVASAEPVRWIDDTGRQANSSRFVKATLDHNLDALLCQHGDLQSVGDAILRGDPEIDLNNTGRRLKDTARVFVDKHGGIVRNVRFLEIIKNPDGTERERRPRQLAEQTVSSDSPLKWTGVFIPKREAVRKFVFSGKAQLQHVNGLTYDFLFAMARDLEQRSCLMLLGSGPKGNMPLVLRRGGTPYRGFLEGRTDGDKYCLLLHFSNLELKPLPPPTPDSSTEAASKLEKPPSKPAATRQSTLDSAPADRVGIKTAKKKARKPDTKQPSQDSPADVTTDSARIDTPPKPVKKKTTRKKAAKKTTVKKTAKKTVDTATTAETKNPAKTRATKKRSTKKSSANAATKPDETQGK